MIKHLIVVALLFMAAACTVIQIEGDANKTTVKKSGQAEIIGDPIKKTVN